MCVGQQRCTVIGQCVSVRTEGDSESWMSAALPFATALANLVPELVSSTLHSEAILFGQTAANKACGRHNELRLRKVSLANVQFSRSTYASAFHSASFERHITLGDLLVAAVLHAREHKLRILHVVVDKSPTICCECLRV